MQGSASLTYLFLFLPKMQLQRRVKIKDHPVRTRRERLFFSPQAGRSWGQPQSLELGGDLKAGGGGGAEFHRGKGSSGVP